MTLRYEYRVLPENTLSRKAITHIATDMPLTET